MSELVPAKRPEGRAGHLSEQEKTAIRLAYLEAAGTKTYKQLAAEFGVNRDTVSACCKGPEFQRLEKQLEAEMRHSAVNKLKALTMPAVDAWGDAIPIAARKGDHRPARELLQHVGIVEAGKEVGGGVLVLTKIDVHTVKGSDGNVYHRNPDTGEIEGLPKADVIVGIGVGGKVAVGQGPEVEIV